MPYGGDPSASFVDSVRFLLGDTDAINELISDSEINYLVTLYGASCTARQIAAYAARSLGHKYAHRATQSIGRVSVTWGELAKQMRDLADDLTTAMGLDAVPFCGGISQSQVTQEEDDTDRPGYVFDLKTGEAEEESDLVS